MPKVTITSIWAHFQTVDSPEEDGNPTEIQQRLTFAHTVEFPRLNSSETSRQRQMWQRDGERWESGIRKSGPQRKEQGKGRCLTTRVRYQERELRRGPVHGRERSALRKMLALSS